MKLHGEHNAVFESMRSYRGKIFEFGTHINRLYKSAKSAGVDIGLTPTRIKNKIIARFNSSGLKDAYIRISVADYPSHRVSFQDRINIIVKKISAYPDEFYKNGVSLVTSATKRHSANCIISEIKSSSFLNSIFAKIEADLAGAFEAVLLNNDGYVTESTVSNIFIIKDLLVSTPPCFSGVLCGITRGNVIEVAKKMGLCVNECILTRHDLYNADEAFLTNTTLEVMPVVSIDERIIGIGKPGEITDKIRKGFKRLVWLKLKGHCSAFLIRQAL